MDEKTFRFDIQSLRAISVLLVIFYHFNFNFQNVPIFSGGFIGVDIFFIISGYVISNLIIKELEDEKRFNLLKFLEKRLRRLVPALYFLLFVVFIAGLFFLLPSRFIQLSNDIIYNVFITSNFYFWESLQKYGAIVGIERPLLHTWSLSVEWQFYIFTSFLFFTLRKHLMKYFNYYFISLFLISIFLNFFLLKNQINFNFYFSGSRYWEFLLGILIRYNQGILIEFVKKYCNEKFINILLFLSLLTIFLFSISYQFLDSKKFYFLLAMFGASIIVLLGNTETLFSKYFNSKNLIFIGAISYSLYIWHYPFASFFFTTEYQNYFNNLTKLIVLIPLSLISIFSYRYIENTFRKSSMISKKNFYLIFFTSSLLLILISFHSINQGGYENRLKISKNQKAFIFDYNQNRKNPIDYPVKIDKKKKTLLVLGNSHGGEYFELLINNKYLENKYNIIYSLIQIKCLKNIVNGINDSANCFRKLEFKKHKDFQYKMSFLNEVDVVVLKTKWSKEDIKFLPKALNFFKKKGKKVIVTAANPEFEVIEKKDFKTKIKYKNPILIHALFQKNTIVDKYYLSKNELPSDKDLKKMEIEYFKKFEKDKFYSINRQLKKISNENDVYFFEDIDIFCDIDKQKCSVLFDKIKIHWDEQGHTTFESKPYLAEKLMFSTNLKDYL